METESDLQLIHYPEASRYEAQLDQQTIAYCEYESEPGRIVFIHTVVKPEHEGRGVGSGLARFALDDAQARGLRIIPVCPFIREYLRRHREYDAIVDYPGRRPEGEQVSPR